jgi:hypothetical protein
VILVTIAGFNRVAQAARTGYRSGMTEREDKGIVCIEYFDGYADDGYYTWTDKMTGNKVGGTKEVFFTAVRAGAVEDVWFDETTGYYGYRVYDDD